MINTCVDLYFKKEGVRNSQTPSSLEVSQFPELDYCFYSKITTRFK